MCELVIGDEAKKMQLMNSENYEQCYPVLFPLKVIGLDEADFESFVIGIVRKHIPELLEENIVSRVSTHQKYRSVSFQFIAESRVQVDALYAELSSHKRVIMIL